MEKERLATKCRRFVEHLTKRRIFRKLPHGVDLGYDVKNILPSLTVETILDVGANRGQSARTFLNCFPAAHVYCFEPVAGTFLELQEELSSNPRVSCFKLAFGSRASQGTMVLEGRAEEFFLAECKKDYAAQKDVPTEEVQILPLDQFCERENIRTVDLLKIDTEGGDLEVLRGAEQMLSEQRIALVQVEAGIHPENRTHVPYPELVSHLREKGYLCFGIYEQSLEFKLGVPALRRADMVFISPKAIAFR